MSRTLINKAVPVMSPAENEFETDRKYVFDVNLVARIYVCAASETLARKVVTSALGSPSRADIRLANEASFILGNCATISDVTFSIGGDIARFASLDTIPPGVEIEVPSDQFKFNRANRPIHARRRRKTPDGREFGRIETRTTRPLISDGGFPGST